ncbi:MAG: ABC transporter ATP-binding protein [Lachnospiraceae bacterium]|nr:ABC transporter ATP-binding protein [Lachnospiraceae bacterium]
MKPENVIEVRDVRKHFKVYYDKGHMLRERVISFYRNKYERREVLKGISFDVKKSESVGLIGKNGCGKSTTLKLLTKILRPNGGTIETKGRVCSLIELGAGFHPDMSGRENIYINASIFGIKAKEVDRRLADIVRFSELEDYIDNPVRTYSSGMYMRLAFSVAINVDADILLIDEILAVGDSSFQTKCFNKLKSLKEAGTTIVIVSHSLGQIEKLCDRAIWIDKGEIRKEGPSRQICKEYLDNMETARLERAELEYRMQLEDEKKREEQRKEEEKRRNEEEKKAKAELSVRRQEEERKRREEEARHQEEAEREQRKREETKRRNASCREIATQCGPDARREGKGIVQFTEVKMLNEKGEECTKFCTGEDIFIKMKYISEQPGLKINFAIGITRSDWVFCYGTSCKYLLNGFLISQSKGEIVLKLKDIHLLKNTYYLDVRIQDEENEKYDNIFNIIEFKVLPVAKKDVGVLLIDTEWNVTK